MSPELISELLSLEGEVCVSHETIYQWIWEVKKSKERVDAEYFPALQEPKTWEQKKKTGKHKG